jgi:AcrR family transcriptional regulator
MINSCLQSERWPRFNYAERTPRLSNRPPRADALRNRVRVLEAAEAAFSAEGLSVPIDEIARRAGVGAGTVYRHFPTKEALFEAIIVGHVERLVDEARSLSSAENPGRAFFEFWTRMVEEGAAKKDLHDALAGAGMAVRSASIGIVEDLRSAMGELLTRAQEAGAVRDDVAIGELMVLLASTSLAMKLRSDDAALPGHLAAIICDGLRPPAP